MSTTKHTRGIIIIIARKSSKAAAEIVKKLEIRNNVLMKFFKPRLLHGPGTEWTSIIINGLSSNTNIHNSGHKDISILERKLDIYDAEPNAFEHRAFISASGDDGFFTNIDGVHSFFSPYKNISLSLIVYLGENPYTEYRLEDLLQAILYVKSNSLSIHSKYHSLVMAWIGIAVNKEIFA